MLKIDNVKKNYGSFILDCSLEIPNGRITGLIGPNGAGKSTTFKAILGLIKKDGGSIYIDEKEIEQLNEKDKQKIGVVLSNSGFSGYLTIEDLLPVLSNLYDQFEKENFKRQCQQFHLPMNQKIKEFSTGMKAKLKVLVAISHQAKVLLLDEPTAGLDVIARDELLEMLREYMEVNEDCSVLISSHISSDLENLCDDLYLMKDGKILLHEDTDVLLSQYAILKVMEDEYETMDHRYLLKIKKEAYGYRCLTNQKQFYIENYPNLVIEKGTIDDLILMMIRGENI